jgi:hypothetical protein
MLQIPLDEDGNDTCRMIFGADISGVVGSAAKIQRCSAGDE